MEEKFYRAEDEQARISPYLWDHVFMASLCARETCSAFSLEAGNRYCAKCGYVLEPFYDFYKLFLLEPPPQPQGQGAAEGDVLAFEAEVLASYQEFKSSLKAAYRLLAKRHHPDSLANVAGAKQEQQPIKDTPELAEWTNATNEDFTNFSASAAFTSEEDEATAAKNTAFINTAYALLSQQTSEEAYRVTFLELADGLGYKKPSSSEDGSAAIENLGFQEQVSLQAKSSSPVLALVLALVVFIFGIGFFQIYSRSLNFSAWNLLLSSVGLSALMFFCIRVALLRKRRPPLEEAGPGQGEAKG